MSDSKFARQTHCVIQNCKTTVHNKGTNITFHSLPTESELKHKWYSILRNRCTSLDWNKSKICSRHFENKYFDSQRQLKHNAIPTQFPITQNAKNIKNQDYSSTTPRTRIDRLLNNLSQTDLYDDIKGTMQQLKVPDQLPSLVTDELQCQPNAPMETQLWLLAKKQDHLITRLMQVVLQNKKHVEVLQKNMEESRAEKKEMEHALENYKYISKCLQEKHATLEEQIEILTAIESRT